VVERGGSVQLSAAAVEALLVVALVVSIVAAILALVALVAQRRVQAAYRTFSMGSRDDVLQLLRRHIDEVAALRGDVASLRGYADELRELVRGGVSKMATVRYDAFEDMGGRLSFSTALLDERGDGVVITSINGRSETRTYAKTVRAGRSRHNLSGEEAVAIKRAMSMTGRTSPRQPRRPGRRVADVS
jgi:hypothetical protein